MTMHEAKNNKPLSITVQMGQSFSITFNLIFITSQKYPGSLFHKSFPLIDVTFLSFVESNNRW